MRGGERHASLHPSAPARPSQGRRQSPRQSRLVRGQNKACVPAGAMPGGVEMLPGSDLRDFGQDVVDGVAAITAPPAIPEGVVSLTQDVRIGIVVHGPSARTQPLHSRPAHREYAPAHPRLPRSIPARACSPRRAITTHGATRRRVLRPASPDTWTPPWPGGLIKPAPLTDRHYPVRNARLQFVDGPRTDRRTPAPGRRHLQTALFAGAEACEGRESMASPPQKTTPATARPLPRRPRSGPSLTFLRRVILRLLRKFRPLGDIADNWETVAVGAATAYRHRRAPGNSNQTRSNIVAIPCPTPMHIVARPSFGVAVDHGVNQRRGDPRTAGPERMADGDRAAADVDLLFVEPSIRMHAKRLRRERFVQLDQVDVLRASDRRA